MCWQFRGRRHRVVPLTSCDFISGYYASSHAVACDSSVANGPALDGRLLSWFPPVVWVSCEPFHVEFNLARPGRRNYPVSPAGSGLFLSRTTPPPSSQSSIPEPC